jgi:hypothetical protein
MTAILAFIALMYALVATVFFFAYHNQPIKTRLALALIAPALLTVGGVMWVVSRLEELG